MKRDDLEQIIYKLSDRVYELEGRIKELDDRQSKMIIRLIDAEEMIEQLSQAYMRRR